MPLVAESSNPFQESRPRVLWKYWSRIRDQVCGAYQLFLFVNYDGTLVELEDDPAQARLSRQTKRLLERLAQRPDVQIGLVSGRSIAELLPMVGLENLWYVGNHGLEVYAQGLSYVNPGAQVKQPLLRRIGQQLQQSLAPVPGTWVEDKNLSVSVHCRCSAAEDRIRVKNAVYEVARPHIQERQVSVAAGQGIFEVQPMVQWNKARILKWLMARQQALNGGRDVLPVYVGDELTDEEAFSALKTRGITVGVDPATPLTQAQYSVQTPQDVHRLLRLIGLARAHKTAVSHFEDEHTSYEIQEGPLPAL